MIFPDIRLSSLKNDAQQKRENFERSQQRLIELVREKTKPLNFFKKHPKIILGAIASVFTGTKILKNIFGKSHREKSTPKKIMGLGLSWNLLMKVFVPIAFEVVRLAVRQSTKGKPI
jgi:hypothetical protein